MPSIPKPDAVSPASVLLLATLAALLALIGLWLS